MEYRARYDQAQLLNRYHAKNHLEQAIALLEIKYSRLCNAISEIDLAIAFVILEIAFLRYGVAEGALHFILASYRRSD